MRPSIGIRQIAHADEVWIRQAPVRCIHICRPGIEQHKLAIQSGFENMLSVGARNDLRLLGDHNRRLRALLWVQAKLQTKRLKSCGCRALSFSVVELCLRRAVWCLPSLPCEVCE